MAVRFVLGAAGHCPLLRLGERREECDVPSSGDCDSRRSCKLACLAGLRKGQLTLQPSPILNVRVTGGRSSRLPGNSREGGGGGLQSANGI